jgi:hypothetical protein
MHTMPSEIRDKIGRRSALASLIGC